MASTMPTKLNIAIVGGGLGGLALARAIRLLATSRPVEINIYEAAAELTQVGAGIVIWPRTWEILKSLQLEETLTKFLSSPPDRKPTTIFNLRKSDQPNGLALHEMIMNGGTMRFHRADLQNALMQDLFKTCNVHLSHKLETFTDTGDKVFLEFENGSTASCDLLVGADGIKSAVRRGLIQQSKMFRDEERCIDPVWSGSVAYRGLVPNDEVQKIMPNHRALRSPTMYCGKNKHIVVYPVSQDRLLNVVAFKSEPSKEGQLWHGPTTTMASTGELESTFLGWEDEVQAIIKCIPKPTKWAIQAVNPLRRYGAGRVVLIGDAAHAMTPHMGAGAGQAIEDGYVLASLISKMTSVQRMIQTYSKIRQPFANDILERSRTQGMWCEFNAPGFELMGEGDTSVTLEQMSDLMIKVDKEWAYAWESPFGNKSFQTVAML